MAIDQSKMREAIGAFEEKRYEDSRAILKDQIAKQKEEWLRNTLGLKESEDEEEEEDPKKEEEEDEVEDPKKDDDDDEDEDDD